MGLDISYQAIPDDCAILERSRHDPAFGANLEFFAQYAILTQAILKHRNYDSTTREFITEAKKVSTNHPGIEKRYLFAGRYWDMLYYLLSENRREGKAKDSSDWGVQALFGGEALNENTVSTIGIPIRYLTSAEVHPVLEKLEKVSIATLRQHWNPSAMDEAAVYKIQPDEGEEGFQSVVESFEELKAFYVQAALHNEGIIVCTS